MKIYVLIISPFFPKTHSRSGQPTGFIDSISNRSKKHTIRANYDLWEKRFNEIEKGKAYLSVRIWEGRPYTSPQKEVFRFHKSDGVGLQKIKSWDRDNNVVFYVSPSGNVLPESIDTIAENDGLRRTDFDDWFRKYDFSDPMAIIHFTPFRYRL